MTVQLPPNYEQFVAEMLGTGGYRSPAEVICDGLDLLRAQAVYRQHGLAQLREQVEIGLEEMRRGSVSEVDPMKLLEEVEQEIRRALDGENLMTFTLPPDLEQFINEQVAQGNYPSAEDAVRIGIEMLREQHLIDQYPADELRRELLIGIEQADRGELKPFDPVGRLAELRRRKTGG